MRSADNATAMNPDRRQGLDVHRRAGRREEEDQRRHRALFGGIVQHVTGRGPDVLNDQTGRQPSQKRLEPERRGEPRQHAAQHEQHDRDLAADDLQIQREQARRKRRRTRWIPQAPTA